MRLRRPLGESRKQLSALPDRGMKEVVFHSLIMRRRRPEVGLQLVRTQMNSLGEGTGLMSDGTLGD